MREAVAGVSAGQRRSFRPQLAVAGTRSTELVSMDPQSELTIACALLAWQVPPKKTSSASTPAVEVAVGLLLQILKVPKTRTAEI